MKKILSLLALLVMTLTAFATDYTGHRTVTYGSMPSTEADDAVLTITDNGDNTFNVTFKDVINVDGSYTDNYGTYTFSNVAGTTENGVTTIDLSNLSVSVENCDFPYTEASDGRLFAKFNAEKAYARFSAAIGSIFRKSTISAEFGVDDFESTGGGEPGGGEPTEKYTVNFDKGAKSTHSGRFLRSFSLQQTGKEKQTESVSASRAAYEDHTSKVFTVEAGSEVTASFNYSGEWMNGYVYIDRDNDGEFSYKEGQWDQAGTDLVAYSFYTTLPNPKVNDGNGYNSTGASVSGNDRSNVNPPSFTAPTEPGTYRIRFKIDWNCILPGGSSDILSDGGGVWDATLEVVAAEPEVVSTLPFENVAYTTSYNEQGTANVTFTEMSDGTFPMTFVSESLNVNAENLTKGTDEKGRTTYTGTAKRTDVDVTFTVNAVVYGEAAAQKLYMTMDNGSGFVVTVGEDPDYVAPVTYKNTLKVVRGTDTKAYENAEVSVLAKGEDKYAVTIPSFTDMDQMEGTIGKLTFEATGVEENGTLKLTATSATTTQEGGSGWDAAAFTASMDATVTGETLAGTFTVVYPNDATNYTYTLYYGVEPPTTPEEPKDVTVVEKYQADGSGFSHTINVDWDKQKIVASIDFSNGGDDKDILAMTTGDSFAAFQTSTYRTMHWYCNQTAKQMSGFFAKDGAGNNNTGRMDVADCLAKFEISKAEGLKVNGEVKMTPTVLEELLTGDPIIIGSGESPKFSNAFYNYIKVVSLDWKEPTEPEVTVKEEKTFNEALYMNDQKVADATVVVKEMSDETINMSLKFGENEYTSTELTKGTDTKGRTTYTGKVANGTQTYDVAGVVYEKDNVARLYMTLKTSITTVVVGENPDVVTPEVTEVSNKTYTSNLRILDGETTVVEEAEADVNIIKYSDESYKVTLKNVNMLNKTQDLVFVGKALIEEAPTEATEPLTIIAKSDEATTTFFGEEMNGTFEITEVSAEEIKMGFVLNNTSLEYQGEFNYTEEETPEVYTSNLHIYDAAAPETDLFQADQAKVEFLATATGGFKLTLKDVTLNEKTQDLVFTGTLPTPQPGGQDPLAEEGETTPAEPAMVLNAIADEATTDFFGGGATYATAVFNVSYDKNDNFMMTFTIAAAAGKNYAGEFNYVKKTPDTPDPELFCKENYVADGSGFEWEIAVDWDTQKIVMSIDPSTCTGSCEDVIGLGAVPTAWDNTLHLYRTSADQMLQGYFQTSADNNNTGKFAETTPFLVEVSKAQGFVVNNEVKIASSAMSYLFTLSTVKMGTGEGVNDKSRATYNYVKVVDKDWTAPKDPDTGINATTVAEGEVEFFTVNGVKLNKLQKGLNIVRTADGKVKKVLVK